MGIVIVNFNPGEKAKGILKAELAKRNISYQRLAELMNQRGWNLTKASIDNRMSRGAFSADFLLDALKVIGCAGIGIFQPDGECPANIIQESNP